MTADTEKFQSFKEFYPYYLAEHSDPTCRMFHFIGSTLVLCILAYAIVTQTWWALALLPVAGYGFAWAGHFFYEHNKPATFTYPWYSLMGDWVMYKDILTGKLSMR
jgi:hypothetical protein